MNTQFHNDSGRHLIGRNHTASERSRMSIGCTRLWLNKSSKCTLLAYKPPDYDRTTRPTAHIAQRARTRATSRGGALFVLSSRTRGALFPGLFFADHHEVAVSTPTHKAPKRIYADGLDIDHRLPGHRHGTRRAKDSDAPFQMAQGDMFVAWRAREMYCRHLSHHNIIGSRVHTKLATQRNMCTNIHETPHIT